MAQLHVAEYEQHQLSDEKWAYFDDIAQQSLKRQQQLEQDNQISFEQYLTHFR